jgi:hypothetical protein
MKFCVDFVVARGRVGGTKLGCKFCERFWDEHWDYSDAWERNVSNEKDLVAEESDQNWALIQRAGALEDIDPSCAFKLYREAAEEGSVWSMRKVGWLYWAGHGIPADPQMALEYYYRAICGGSWMATIHYARLLDEIGRHDDCEKVLENGVASDFVPAYFWLAWLRYERSRTSEVRKQVQPLLEYSARKGHPAARSTLARWLVLGQLGLLHIPRGLGLAIRGAVSFARRPESMRAS